MSNRTFVVVIGVVLTVSLMLSIERSVVADGYPASY